MPIIKHNGTQLEVDEDGFITDPSLWNKDLAVYLANHAEGISKLTEDHWRVIDYLNQYYHEFNKAPMVRKICKETGFNLKEIYSLFPGGPANGACKVAGLPKPTGCV
jgi:tRNA 2-thiouridine synthesizing protein E